MFDPATLQAIANAGGWVFAAVMLASGSFVVFRAFATGALVPGALLTRALEANDKMADALEKLTGAVGELTNSTSNSMRDLRDDIRELRQSGFGTRRD